MSSKYVYHYCNNLKGFSILQGKTIRLSDICKSNDYREMKLFYPSIFNKIIEIYERTPYPFTYLGKTDHGAMITFIDEIASYFDDGFDNGYLSNFVMCFSEEGDMLSQWRNYADAGRGICLGFDKDGIKEFVNSNKKVYSFSKIKYINNQTISDLSNKSAQEIYDELKTLRGWIVDNMTKDNNDPDTDSLLSFNISSVILGIFGNSLRYKHNGFKEEKEWRLFLKNPNPKVPEWIFVKEDAGKDLRGPNGFVENISSLKNRMDFLVSNDDIIPYYSLPFDLISNRLIRSITIGPNSKIREKDLKLVLTKFDYRNDVEILRSSISYTT